METVKSGDMIKARFNVQNYDREGLKLVRNNYYKIYTISVRADGKVIFSICVENDCLEEYCFEDLRKDFILAPEFDTTEVGGPKSVIVPRYEISKPIPVIEELSKNVTIHQDIIGNISNELRQVNEFLISINNELNSSL